MYVTRSFPLSISYHSLSYFNDTKALKRNKTDFISFPWLSDEMPKLRDQKWFSETTQVVQWLRLCVSKARAVSSIPGWGTKIPTCHEVWPKKKVVLEEVGWFCPKGIFGKIWRYFWVVTAGIVLLSLSKGLEYLNFLLCTGQLKKNCSAPNVAEIKLAFYFQRIQSDGVGWSRNPGLELSLVYSPLPLALKTGVT